MEGTREGRVNTRCVFGGGGGVGGRGYAQCGGEKGKKETVNGVFCVVSCTKFILNGCNTLNIVERKKQNPRGFKSGALYFF